MVPDFEIIDHTADIGIVVHGGDLTETFANAAYAMFSLIADLSSVDEAICHEVEASADDLEGLLVGWLNELIYLFDVENIIFKRFELTELTGIILKAKCYGEKVDPSRHKLKTGIKAATSHMLKIEKKDGFRAQVLFDI
jgi:SHS2 domain-containing protein